jgi:hypothetical protein
MPKNKISDLRDHLFETLEALKDKEAPMDLDRAKAICGVAKHLIESAKVEVDYIRVVGETLGQTVEVRAPFFGDEQKALPPAKSNGKGGLQ